MFVRVPLGDIFVIPTPDQDGAYSPNTLVTLTATPKVSGAHEIRPGVFLKSGGDLVWVGVDTWQEGTAYIEMLEDRFVEIQPRFTLPHPIIPCG